MSLSSIFRKQSRVKITRKDFLKTIDSLNVDDEERFEPKNIYLPKISKVDFPPEMDFSLPVCVTKDVAEYVRELLRVLNSKSDCAEKSGFYSWIAPRHGKSTILYILACVAWAKKSFLFYVRDGTEWLNSNSPYVYFLQTIKRQNSSQVLKKHLKKHVNEQVIQTLLEQDELDYETKNYIPTCFRAVETMLIDDGFELMKLTRGADYSCVWKSLDFTEVLNHEMGKRRFLSVCDSRECPFFNIHQHSFKMDIQLGIEEADLDCYKDIVMPKIDAAIGEHNVLSAKMKQWIALLALEEAGGVIGIAKEGINDLRKLQPQEINCMKETQEGDEYSSSAYWPVVQQIREAIERQFDQLSKKFWTEKVLKHEIERVYCERLQEYLNVSDETKEERLRIENVFQGDLFNCGLVTAKPHFYELFLCDLARWSFQKMVREELQKYEVMGNYHGRLRHDEFLSKILCSIQEKGVHISDETNRSNLKLKNKMKQTKSVRAKDQCLNLPAPDVSFRVCGRNEKNLQLLFQTDSRRFVRMCLEFHPEVTIALYPATFSLKLWDVALVHKTQGVKGTDTPSYTICFFHVTADGTKHLKELQTDGAKAATEILDQLCLGSLIKVRGKRFEVTYGRKKNLNICTRFFLVSAAKIIQASPGNLEIISGDDVKKSFEVDVNKAAFSNAAMKEEKECVQKMIEAGVDVNTAPDKSGRTVLMMKADEGSVNCVKWLIQAGADVNKASRSGSALFQAGICGNVGCVKVLLRAGANVNKVRMCEPDHNISKIKKLLKAAGERTNGKDDYEPLDIICLKHICRDAIRKHLLENSEVNLFFQTSRLGLPSSLRTFLMFDQTLEDEDDDD